MIEVPAAYAASPLILLFDPVESKCVTLGRLGPTAVRAMRRLVSLLLQLPNSQLGALAGPTTETPPCLEAMVESPTTVAREVLRATEATRANCRLRITVVDLCANTLHLVSTLVTISASPVVDGGVPTPVTVRRVLLHAADRAATRLRGASLENDSTGSDTSVVVVIQSTSPAPVRAKRKTIGLGVVKDGVLFLAGHSTMDVAAGNLLRAELRYALLHGPSRIEALVGGTRQGWRDAMLEQLDGFVRHPSIPKAGVVDGTKEYHY